MNFFKTIILFVVIFSGLFSCQNSYNYDKQIKELDSLKVVITESLNNLKQIDSAYCVNALNTQNMYLQFIEAHTNDTLSKSQAQSLQQFSSIYKSFKTFNDFRLGWIANATQSINQLHHLSKDLQTKSLNNDEANKFVLSEKKNAEIIIHDLKQNALNMRQVTDAYKQYLPEWEALVKQLNNGQLPTSINQ